jgi:hypothetical protein
VVTALEELAATPVTIYPNPLAGNKFYLQADQLLSEPIIRDLQGRKHELALQPVSPNLYEVRVHLPAGIYLVSLGNQSKRLLVK